MVASAAIDGADDVILVGAKVVDRPPTGEYPTLMEVSLVGPDSRYKLRAAVAVASAIALRIALTVGVSVPAGQAMRLVGAGAVAIARAGFCAGAGRTAAGISCLAFTS